MGNYIRKIRKKLGHDKFIHPAARILIENEEGEYLFIRKNDSGKLGIPAGGLEEGETIEECIKREVKEETGLEIISLEVIGIGSSPEKEFVEYWNGDKIQYFTVEFYSNNWKGKININDRAEIKSANFFDKDTLNDLPENEKSLIESLKYYRENNVIMLK